MVEAAPVHFLSIFLQRHQPHQEAENTCSEVWLGHCLHHSEPTYPAVDDDSTLQMN